MIDDKRFSVKGGFSPDSIIASENLMEWAQKEAEKNMREKNPLLRAFNTISLNVNQSILPANPMSEKEIQELEQFPFNQINNIAPPSKNKNKVMEIQQSLPEEALKASSFSAVDTTSVSKAFFLDTTKANEFFRYIKGEIKTM